MLDEYLDDLQETISDCEDRNYTCYLFEKLEMDEKSNVVFYFNKLLGLEQIKSRRKALFLDKFEMYENDEGYIMKIPSKKISSVIKKMQANPHENSEYIR